MSRSRSSSLSAADCESPVLSVPLNMLIFDSSFESLSLKLLVRELDKHERERACNKPPHKFLGHHTTLESAQHHSFRSPGQNATMVPSDGSPGGLSREDCTVSMHSSDVRSSVTSSVGSGSDGMYNIEFNCISC